MPVGAVIEYDLRGVQSISEALERIYRVAVLQQCADALQTTHEIEARRDSAGEETHSHFSSDSLAYLANRSSNSVPPRRSLPILLSSTISSILPLPCFCNVQKWSIFVSA